MVTKNENLSRIEKKTEQIIFYVSRKDRVCFGMAYPSPGWYTRNEVIPEQKPITIQISGARNDDIIVSSAYKGYKQTDIKVCKGDYHNLFTVTVKRVNNLESFEFGTSIHDIKQLKPKLVLSESDQIYAFYCFVNDAIEGTLKFQEFKDEIGFEDCCEAHKIWKLCQESTLKCARLGMGDLYELSNYLQEKYPDVV